MTCVICFRTDQDRDAPQCPLRDYEDHPSRENAEVSSYNLGTLDGSKHSGLSSSSCELSQYMTGADPGEPDRQQTAPLKYSIPHAVVSFGPAGQLVRVAPGFFTQERVSQLEIHSLEVWTSVSTDLHHVRGGESICPQTRKHTQS